MIDNMFILNNLDDPSSWNLAERILTPVISFFTLSPSFPFAEFRVPNLCLFIHFYIETFHFKNIFRIAARFSYQLLIYLFNNSIKTQQLGAIVVPLIDMHSQY